MLVVGRDGTSVRLVNANIAGVSVSMSGREGKGCSTYFAGKSPWSYRLVLLLHF
jgi:hypothetical protein